jgi:hypothetical protein
MYKSSKLILGLFFVALVATGCVKKADVKKASEPIHHVAVVSLSVANWGGTMTGTSGSRAHAARLIDSTMSGMLSVTERKLGSVMRVTNASSFVRNSGYRHLGVKNDLRAMVPKVHGTPMQVFAKNNSELVAAGLSPRVAKKLCAELHVQAVVVVYSEWSYSVGHFVPTKRALAKNVVSVWDRKGNEIFHQRVDMDGRGVLGGPVGPIVVNEGTIKQWEGAYIDGLDKIIPEMKKLTHA